MKIEKMKYRLRGFVLGVFIICLPGGVLSQAMQDSLNMIKYTPEFKFREGIFLNALQVQKNQPVPKSRVITNVDYDDREYYTKVLDKKDLLFYDHLGWTTGRLWRPRFMPWAR